MNDKEIPNFMYIVYVGLLCFVAGLAIGGSWHVAPEWNEYTELKELACRNMGFNASIGLCYGTLSDAMSTKVCSPKGARVSGVCQSLWAPVVNLTFWGYRFHGVNYPAVAGREIPKSNADISVFLNDSILREYRATGGR